MLKKLKAIAMSTLCTVPLTATAQEADLVQAARTTLTGIQSNSFSADREYCGMIGRNAQGNLVITRPRKGRTDSCLPRNFRSDAVEVLASYHTHGSYDYDADSEVPSVDDFNADSAEGVIGFVSTPGGRFWVILPERGMVRQICGLGCLPKDPNFEAGVAGQIPRQMTIQQLEQREG